MILIALLLVSHDPPSVRHLIHLGFRPYDARMIVRLSPEEQRAARISMRICGPDGSNDWDDYYGPSCERSGWNQRTRRYRGNAK